MIAVLARVRSTLCLMTTPIDKPAIRRRLLAVLQGGVGAAADQARTEQTGAEIDPGTAYNIDDLGQSDQDGEFRAEMQGVAAGAREAINRLKKIDITPADTVRPGAVVSFGGDNYFIGVAASEFTADGRTFTGVATDAPIYETIAGLRRGDRFTFRDTEYLIDDVV